MRKITEEATRAFHNGYDFKKDNTEVVKNEDGIRFYLHGNCIAKKVYGDGLYLSHCGWETNTTKERLNGILYPYQDRYIYQKDFQWYLHEDGKDKEFAPGWNKVL